MTEFFEVEPQYVDVGEVTLRVRVLGDGPPVVLLHGHPRTHTTWHRVAPVLAAAHTVVCPDLRGYGRSTTTATREDHSQASKRAMASDVVELMQWLGHDRFAVVGHDRGSYVAQRLTLDHPDLVSHLVILDSVPIGAALARANAAFAQSWWHWFFLGQTAKPAEPLICANPVDWYRPDEELMGADNCADLRAAIHDPDVVHAMCEDYRAGLGVDRAADDADVAAGRRIGCRIGCPVLMLWATRDDMVDLYGDPLAVWREWATDVSGFEIESAHHLAEEAPAELAEAILGHLRRQAPRTSRR